MSDNKLSILHALPDPVIFHVKMLDSIMEGLISAQQYSSRIVTKEGCGKR